mmetsp:Transcript_18154/g.39311  ORF Transcript_18154/g.39311 Transcript_18154/m.39311 type:complete len:231 (+) Transcript_18154:2-694(+)
MPSPAIGRRRMQTQMTQTMTMQAQGACRGWSISSAPPWRPQRRRPGRIGRRRRPRRRHWKPRRGGRLTKSGNESTNRTRWGRRLRPRRKWRRWRPNRCPSTQAGEEEQPVQSILMIPSTPPYQALTIRPPAVSASICSRATTTTATLAAARRVSSMRPLITAPTTMWRFPSRSSPIKSGVIMARMTTPPMTSSTTTTTITGKPRSIAASRSLRWTRALTRVKRRMGMRRG